MPRRPFGSAIEKLEFAWHAEVEEAMRGLGSSIEEKAGSRFSQQHRGLVSSSRLGHRRGGGDRRSLLPPPQITTDTSEVCLLLILLLAWDAEVEQAI